jgi:hypothetical protein
MNNIPFANKKIWTESSGGKLIQKTKSGIMVYQTFRFGSCSNTKKNPHWNAK